MTANQATLSSTLIKSRSSIADRPMLSTPPVINPSSASNNGKFLPPCSVKNLKDLSMEIKYSCGISSGVQNIANPLSSNYNLLQDLNTKFISPSDKQEFRKQIEASKTVGKEVRSLNI
jgi:hypothetical protein